MTMKYTFGSRLKEVRARLGLTQQQLADRVANTSRAAVGQWEIDASRPCLPKIEAIAAVGGVRSGWLAFGEGSPFVQWDHSEFLETDADPLMEEVDHVSDCQPDEMAGSVPERTALLSFGAVIESYRNRIVEELGVDPQNVRIVVEA